MSPNFVLILHNSCHINGYSPCNWIVSTASTKDFVFAQITDLLKQKNNTIRPLKARKRNWRDKNEIRAEIQEAFDADLDSVDSKVYIYKCFVGLGKTRMYLEKLMKFIDEEETVLIALPSHKLKDDIVRRLSEHLSTKLIDDKVIIVPDIPCICKTFEKELKSYYAIGDYRGARKFIENYDRDVIRKKNINDISEVEKQLGEYLNC